MSNILIKPIVTEKMTEQAEDLNQYGFIVNRQSNKVEIRKAVEEMYGVSVKSVNTMIYPGKAKSRYTRGGAVNGRTSQYKKAIITLVDGDTIDFFNNI